MTEVCSQSLIQKPATLLLQFFLAEVCEKYFLNTATEIKPEGFQSAVMKSIH